MTDEEYDELLPEEIMYLSKEDLEVLEWLLDEKGCGAVDYLRKHGKKA